MKIVCGIVVLGTTDAKTFAQARDVAHRAALAALMADNHLGYIVPVGGVAASQNRVSAAGVGFDIACGNAAIRTDLKLADITDELTLGEVQPEAVVHGPEGERPRGRDLRYHSPSASDRRKPTTHRWKMRCS